MDRKPITIFAPEGVVQENAVEQMNDVMEHPQAVAGALMGDHHLGYEMPIGGVVAYQDAISPSGVGYDIACGNMCVRTNIQLKDLIDASDAPNGMIPVMPPEEFNAKIKPIMREIQKKIEFGMGRKNATPVDDPVMDDGMTWSEIAKQIDPNLREKAAAQLGTVGSGNHYVDLLVSEDGSVWVANHFGSRGLGHTIATWFIKEGKKLNPDSKTVVIPTDTDLGEFYIAAMHKAGYYAYAGREYVIAQVLNILGAQTEFTVHNHHNFAWFENGLWIVRKGATPLTTEPAFIGGSMGDFSAIVTGTQNDAPEADQVDEIGAIGSAPHGAGRVMSRTKAAGKFKKEYHKGRKLYYRDKSTAAIDWDAERAQLTARGITVLGAGADEAPGVYKSLREVLAAHDNVQVETWLRPIGVVMAGDDIRDPYKD